jgi:hypothetical protein
MFLLVASHDQAKELNDQLKFPLVIFDIIVSNVMEHLRLKVFVTVWVSYFIGGQCFGVFSYLSGS